MNRAAAFPMPHGHVIKRARPLLGTLVEVGASGASQDEIGMAINQAFAAVELIQFLMSYHNPASDVSRLNRAGTACVTVHPHTWQVLATAREVAEVSDGQFDVSIAPELVRHGYLPHHTDLARPATEANWQHIELLSDHQVQLTRSLHLDLGGIAKGYAVDCAIRALQDAGMPSGLVNAGGDLRLFGHTAETIYVRHPQMATRLFPLCELKEGAVATSAPYYAGRQANGQTISPLIDASTRQPCTDERSVSVLADSCTLADALTKVVYANPAHALAALNHFGAQAVVIEIDPNTPSCCRVRRSERNGWRDATQLDPEAATA